MFSWIPCPQVISKTLCTAPEECLKRVDFKRMGYESWNNTSEESKFIEAEVNTRIYAYQSGVGTGVLCTGLLGSLFLRKRPIVVSLLSCTAGCYWGFYKCAMSLTSVAKWDSVDGSLYAEMVKRRKAKLPTNKIDQKMWIQQAVQNLQLNKEIDRRETDANFILNILIVWATDEGTENSDLATPQVTDEELQEMFERNKYQIGDIQQEY
jgi:hypothetical protein